MVTNRVGPPVRGADLFGREAFVDLVWQKVDAGHVMLAAPRRFGKTSVMYRLIDAPRGGYKIVHSDLEHLTEPADLITELIVRLAADSATARITEGLAGFGKDILNGLRKNIDEVGLFNVKVKLKEQLRPQWQESGRELFQKISHSHTPVLFLLDEFPMMIDRMARSPAHREEAVTLLRWLRALRIAPEIGSVRFLIAGSIGIDAVLADLGESKSINDFEKLRLDPFPSKVAAAFLDHLAEGANVPLTEASRRAMLDLVGTLVPYFLQILFSEVSKAYMLDGERITPKRVAQIYRDKVLGVDCKTYFDHYYGRLRDYYKPTEERATKRLLRELAVTGSLSRDSCFHLYTAQTERQADIEDFNILMTNLENDFYIRYDGGTRQFEFSCKLLRDWWLRHYALEVGG